MLLLSAGHGGEGEDSKDAAASPHWKRHHKWVRAATESSAPLFKRLSSWDVLHQGTYASVTALPMYLMAEGRPLSRISTSTGRFLSGSSSTAHAGGAPSGLFPGGADSSRWWSPTSGED
jgi:hypothetical protein